MQAYRNLNPPNDPDPDPSPPRRRGRPVGSVTLTPDIQATIVTYVRAGAFDSAAAEAAGIPERTFRDWMARGESRSDRASTPKLRAFARAVRRAKAEARAAAEVRVYRERPTYWLPRAARTTREREGWTDPAKGQAAEAESTHTALARLTDEELGEALGRVLRVGLQSGNLIIPRCPHPRCRCPWHKPRPPRG